MKRQGTIQMRRQSFNLAVGMLTVAFFGCLSAAGEVLARGGTFVEDKFGSGGIYQFEIEAEPGALVSIERMVDQEGEEWETVTPEFVAVGGGQTLTFPSEDREDGLFRVVARESPVRVRREEQQIELNLKEPAPVSQVLEALRRDLGIYASLANQSETTAPDPFVKAGSYSARTVGNLGRDLGVRLWAAPPGKDDPELAEEIYPGNAGLKPGKPIEVPGDENEGRIEEGWKGDEIEDRPEEGRLDPPEPKPGREDMPFNPEGPDEAKGPQDDEGIIPFGRHVRLTLRLKRSRDFEFVSVARSAGEMTALEFHPAPSTGDVVWVVSSPDLVENFPGGITYLNSLPSPLNVHAYNPPFRGAHGSEIAESTDLRMPIPTSEKIPLERLEIRLYEVVENFPFQTLSPELFLEARNSFSLLAELSGEDLSGQLEKQKGKESPQGKALGSTKDATITSLHRAGSKASKINIAIFGDGFVDSTADQDAFNDYVENVIMNDFLERDVHQEIQNSINIFRINTYSRDSGITRADASGDPIDGQIQRTALDYEYSGIWNRCWMERGPETLDAINDISSSLLPEMDMYFVVLNTNSGGGCRRGNEFAVTLASGAGTVSHEFGHLFASLGDEYQCNQGANGCGCYTGGEAGLNDNLTTITNRANLKWNRWVPPFRPLPTAAANIADATQDVGAFPGAVTNLTRFWCGLLRPSSTGRMRTGARLHNPVGYTKMKDSARPNQDADFRKSVRGDFNGDGLSDLVLLDGRQLSLYLAGVREVGPDDPVSGAPLRSADAVLEPVWYETDFIRNASRTRSWQVRPSDKLYVGDFDGDGRDDLFIVNLTAWNKSYLGMLKSFGDHFEPVRRFDGPLPGWDEMRRRDEFYVADFNNDNRDDLMVFNGHNWNQPYFLMLRSTGDNLAYSKRYDTFLPGWEMGRDEEFHVADYDGDGREEVIAHNPNNWSQVHLMVFSSTGSRLRLTDRFYGVIPDFWQMRRRDKIYPLDFNGDGASDLAIFNGRDWGPTYLGLLRSGEEGNLVGVRRYDNGSSQRDINGWQLQRRDRFWVGDVDGDEADDLIVYNSDNWNTEYLGILRSDGNRNLSGSWQDDWIGSWNLSAGDSFHVSDFRGSGGWADLFVYNKNWFGLLRGYRTSFRMEAIYPKWIHNHRYHSFGWW